MRFPNQPRPLVISDILRRIQEVVSARMYTITKEMVDLDYANINTISKTDFKTICDRHFMRLTDEQVISSTTWASLIVPSIAWKTTNSFSFKTCGKYYQLMALEIWNIKNSWKSSVENSKAWKRLLNHYQVQQEQRRRDQHPSDAPKQHPVPLGALRYIYFIC